MQNIKFINETRTIGKPVDWDETLDGDCQSLSVFDHIDTQSGIPFMQTAWLPSESELEQLVNGGYIVLNICGRTHPVISITTSTHEADQECD